MVYKELKSGLTLSLFHYGHTHLKAYFNTGHTFLSCLWNRDRVPNDVMIPSIRLALASKVASPNDRIYGVEALDER